MVGEGVGAAKWGKSACHTVVRNMRVQELETIYHRPDWSFSQCQSVFGRESKGGDEKEDEKNKNIGLTFITLFFSGAPGGLSG